MAQLPLFRAEDILLADDERGRMVYSPGFVDPPTAQQWFEELHRDVDWHASKRMMYDREVDVPRLLGSFRLDPPPDSVPRAILDARDRVAGRLDILFNAVGLNLYRDGRDSVAPHNDHLYEIRAGFPIALVSLGATRRMVIRAKEPPRGSTDARRAPNRPEGRRALSIDLEAGSLFVMDYATQLHYTHAVPKTNEAVGERISLAFRMKRPSRTGRY